MAGAGGFKGLGTNVKSTCMIEGCERQVRVRGLCLQCYQSAFVHVKAGRTSWEQLEAAGLALPARAYRRSPFVIAFNKAEKSKNTTE